MSGRKVSSYRLAQETLRILQQQRAEQERIRRDIAERKKTIANIAQQQQAVSSISTKLSTLLKNTPQGLKDTFSDTVKKADQWTNRIQKTRNSTDTNGSNYDLQFELSKINSQRDEGQQYLKMLTKNFTKDADIIEKSIIDDLIDLNAKFDENKESLNYWVGSNEVNKIVKDLTESERCIKEKKLKDATDIKNRIAEYLNTQISSVDTLSTVFNQYEQEMEILNYWFDEEMRQINKKFDESKILLQNGDYATFNRKVSEIQVNLDKKISDAKELDEKDKKRNFVLESLKKVCTSMGFEEVGYSIEGKGKSNRIIYTIDTFSQGKIKFSISLESIDADSGIVDNHCLSEFDKVSESLQNNFGIQTRFTRISESGPDKLIRKGEKDEPDGVKLENSTN